MTTLHIDHPITDYSTWRAAFDAFSAVRREAGVTGGTVSRPLHDERFIMVDLEFADTARARAFLEFLETQVWAVPTASPALVGRPRAVLVEVEPGAVV